ncbi:MAG: hypothetical protein ACI9UR_001684 [Bacteroidia bacterium]
MNEKPQEISIQRTSTLNGINSVGNFLKKIGLDPFKLNAEKVIAKAKKKACFKGQVPESTIQGLTVLIDSINKESRANPFGNLAIKGLLGRTLYGRLKVEQEISKNPDIVNRPISQPIFIIGMPRTGTTILHALMHEDPAHRSPLAWECLLPHPVPSPNNFKDNAQLNTVVKEFGQLFKLVPDFQKKHHMSAESPQECIGVNMLDFNSFQTSAQVYIPSYFKWFMNDADRLSTMKFHKRFLQYLESGGVGAERWLLKSPVHLMRLDEIFEVYPDARIIMTHRHPTKVVASAASLISSVRSLYSDYEDELRSGKEQAEVWSECFNRFLDSRKRLNKEDQIIDLRFEDFVKDQMATVKNIYDRFGWDLSEEAQTRMKKFLKQNPKEKHGAHDYTLEKFGLTEKGIEKQYSKYINFLNKLD